MAGRLLSAIRGNSIAGGAETMPRMQAGSGVTTATGVMRLTYFTPSLSFTASRVSAASHSTAAAATPTLIRLGIYEVDSAGAGTLVAATASDTTLFASQNSLYTKDLSATLAVRYGQRYAVGVLVVTAQQAPTLHGANNSNSGGVNALDARLSASIGSLTDLPASFVAGDLTNTGSVIWTALRTAA